MLFFFYRRCFSLIKIRNRRYKFLDIIKLLKSWSISYQQDICWVRRSNLYSNMHPNNRPDFVLICSRTNTKSFKRLLPSSLILLSDILMIYFNTIAYILDSACISYISVPVDLTLIILLKLESQLLIWIFFFILTWMDDILGAITNVATLASHSQLSFVEQ